MKAGIKVFAPATVSNVVCGYDVLGFALDHPGDEIIARFSDTPGLRITRIIGTKGKKLPYDIQSNTAGVAAAAVLRHLGEEERGIELEIHKKMPFASGLGSSAASAVAGAVAVNELLRCPLQQRELLPFAMAGEQIADGAYHADNVAPSLIGGMIFIRHNPTLDVHRISVPRGLYAVVVHPNIQIFTKDSRAILNKTIQLQQHVEQSGNLGGLIIGLYNSDLDLIKRSLQDGIIEPQRAHLIPHFHAVQQAALEAGALGCSLSGAGPSMFALCANSLIAEQVGEAMQSVFFNQKIRSKLFISTINQEGAVKL